MENDDKDKKDEIVGEVVNPDPKPQEGEGNTQDDIKKEDNSPKSDKANKEKENKKKAVARKRSIATTDRPSVRKELQEIKQEKLKSAAPKMPIKNKSKKKVR